MNSKIHGWLVDTVASNRRNDLTETEKERCDTDKGEPDSRLEKGFAIDHYQPGTYGFV